MLMKSNYKKIKLDFNKVAKVAQDQTITVVSGILWVTYANDIEDYFYYPGDTFSVCKNNPALIEALADAEYRVS